MTSRRSGSAWTSYSEDDLFDMIDFLYEHCSKPIEKHLHHWNECGWHGDPFEEDGSGKAEFREKVNTILPDYDKGYELSPDGQLLNRTTGGLKRLVEAQLPGADPVNVTVRVSDAERKFLRYRSTMDERRGAIRDLADVLEYLQQDVIEVLTKAYENDLFSLLNLRARPGLRAEPDSRRAGYLPA
jgi:hypothetical protein